MLFEASGTIVGLSPFDVYCSLKLFWSSEKAQEIPRRLSDPFASFAVEYFFEKEKKSLQKERETNESGAKSKSHGLLHMQGISFYHS